MSIFVGECLGNGNSSVIQISVCESIQACFMLFAHGMAELLPKMTGKVKKAPKPKAVTKREETDKIYCPECGEPLVFEEGCNICKSCGWSKCH